MYFSPTGSTRQMTTTIAAEIASEVQIPVETLDYTLPGNRETQPVFSDTDFVVLGSPVYAGKTPNLMLPWLESFLGNNTPVVLLACYGNRSYQDALSELRYISEQRGFIPIAAAAIVSRHPMSAALGEGRLAKGHPDRDDESAAVRFAHRIWHFFKMYGLPDARLDVPGNDPPGPYYRPKGQTGEPVNFLKAKPLTSDACDQCGICAKLCPTGAVSKDDAAVVNGICMKCMACVLQCPKHAKTFADENLLSHVQHLEETYVEPQKKPEWFYGWKKG